MLHVRVDLTRNQVILHSDHGYEAVLPWHTALNLGSMLQAAAAQVEPAALAGRTYCPATER